ncbi:MAG: DUF1572 family protein [Bacteroidia bacterium]
MILENHLLENVTGVFKNYKSLAEKSFIQLTNDKDFHYIPDPESNSIAVIINHISGNMISRWTNFLHSDGEKPFRNRDREFISGNESRAELLESWDVAWDLFFLTLKALTETDLLKTVTIRGEALTVTQALLRQMAHYSYHIGQIVFIAKHLRQKHWQSLSIPKNQSSRYSTGNYLDNLK